ncbi:MAG: ATP synthase F1 subunit gamma [Bacteroidia bacterium]|nr:ATP synthase F1 subunit gamma [Bacteroidia bacterium]MBT8229948.1 ATP synthase F1 subunit gamma [Bacteroidia bacterium]NNK90519.1 ATP synthase F1 subunit gamma [Saprospiraceae bacterium]
MSGKLKEVRERIVSVRSTQQITKAMKMVSAAKFRKAQQAITEMRPYADRLNKMMINILSNVEGGDASSFSVEREIKKMAIVVVTSNRGLAGAFNSNIGKKALEVLDNYDVERRAGKVDIIFIGKKGYDFLKRRVDGCNLNRDYIDATIDLSYDNISSMADKLMDVYSLEEYDMIHVVYAQFKNAAVQIPVAMQFLPVPKLEIVKSDKKKMRADYIFEPNKDELLESLIPSILQTSFHKCVLDTTASEHGARMTAMDKATENANELLKDLKITYNKARQESITNEILEIVGGAAALEG